MQCVLQPAFNLNWPPQQIARILQSEWCAGTRLFCTAFQWEQTFKEELHLPLVFFFFFITSYLVCGVNLNKYTHMPSEYSEHNDCFFLLGWKPPVSSRFLQPGPYIAPPGPSSSSLLCGIWCLYRLSLEAAEAGLTTNQKTKVLAFFNLKWL